MSAEPVRPALLTVSRLAVRPGARLLVDGLELAVHVGERWAVLGRNGAGKSSLLLAMAGVAEPASGEVCWDGRPVRSWPIDALAGRRALVTDRWHDPFATRVLEVVLGARYRLKVDPDGPDIALAALEEMDVSDLADRDVRRLSRGERQRVAIAAALAQQTPLVLLDEPTAHQDPPHQLHVVGRLRQRAGQAFVAVLHDVNVATLFATHVLLLWGDGRWRAGPADRILSVDTLSGLYGVPMQALAADDGRSVYVPAVR